MALPNIDPERYDPSQVDIPRKSLSKLVLPDKAIPKADIPEMAERLSETLREFTDSMTAYVMLKQAEQIIKSALDQTLDHALAKMDGKEMTCFGATVSMRSLMEYQYDDSGLADLERKLKELKEKIDARKEFMRLIKTPVADTETGEVVQPAKLIRDGSTLAIKFK